MDAGKRLDKSDATDSVVAVLEDEWHLLFGSPSDPPQIDLDDTWPERLDRLEGDEMPTALCLSGGGIRSATFCLGVIQGLAARKRLSGFHYLSTVSGGGYIGAWLTSWIARDGGRVETVEDQIRNSLGSEPADAGVPRRASLGSPAPKEPLSADAWPIARLRAYTNYLSPVWGLSVDAFTLVATFLRNLALHSLSAVPLLISGVLLARLQVSIQAGTPDAFWVDIAAGLAVFCVAGAVAYIASDLPGLPLKPGDSKDASSPTNRFGFLCMTPLLTAAMLLSWITMWVSDPNSAGATAYAGQWLKVERWPDLLRFASCGAALHILGAFVGWMLRPLRGLAPRRYTYPVRALLAALSTGAVGGLGLAGLLAFAQGLGHDKLYDWSGVYAAVAVPLFLLVFWAAVTFYVGAARRFTSEDDREWWSRASAVSLALTVGWTLLTTIIICVPEWILSMPWLNRHEEGHASGIIGLSTAILGVLSSAWGFWSKRGAAIAQSVEALRTKLGLRLLDLAALVFAVMLLVSTSIASSIGAQYAGLLRSTAVGQLSKAAQDAAIEKQARQACVARTEALPCPSPKYSGAEEDRVPAGKTFLIVERETDSGRLSLAILGFFMLGFLVTAAAGVNAFSLHSMYGNRLIRSFLGASRGPQRKPHWFTGFDPEDNPAMEAIVPKGKRLFHVVNIALNLTEPAGGRLEWQQRKAAPFVVTPRYSGSPALGFVPSRIYGKSASSARDDHARTQLPGKADLPDSAAGPKRGWLTARLPSLSGAPANMIFGEGITLGRAMAISGAAASPNMGYQTSALVAFAMSMFNVRLGWWLPNPKLKFASSWPYEEPRGGVFTTLREATGRTSDDGAFVYLSDGGHFENLGLYEMVRRRCRRIVVVDATHDPNFAYEDLENCIRRVRIDFGASISFANGLPTAESVRRTGKHFALGEIVYKSSRSGDLPSGADVATGRITYIKPSISGDEPEDVLRYATATRRRAGSAFPHDPTWRQDFDEAQFESYRELGLHSVAGVFTDADPWSPTAVAPIHRLPPVPPPSGVGIAAGGKGSNDGKAAGVGLGALAAAALLTGTVAVTGTVALTKDSKVRLEPDSVALTNNQVAFDGGTYELVSKAIRTSELNSAAVDKLTKAIGPSVNLSPDHSSQSDPVQPSVEPLNSATTLIDALNHLSIRIPANGPSPDILVIRAQILQLQQAVIDITKDSATNRDLAPLVRELQVATVALLKATATLEQSNSRAASASASAVDFGPIVMELRKIQSAILSATPRRNVSGLPEGGRP